MAGQSSRLGKYKAASSVAGFLLIVVGVALAVVGFVNPEPGPEVMLVLGGCIVVLMGLVVLIAAALWIKMESSAFRIHGEVYEIREILLKKQEKLLEKIAENSALSDAAKSLANRQQECEALRAAIRADIRTEQWDAALALIDGMAERFGYVDEADALRKEVTEVRNDTMRKKFTQASGMIKDLLNDSQWEKALHEIDRLEHALPDEPSISELRNQYDEMRTIRKEELIAQWKKAAECNDVDTAIGTLQQLDPLLTRKEARSLEDSAREVFKLKLLQLGTQFQFAVSEQRWNDALEIGVQIMEEFPNSRMSHEVHDAMSGLRKRAGLLGDIEETTYKKAGTGTT